MCTLLPRSSAKVLFAHFTAEYIVFVHSSPFFSDEKLLKPTTKSYYHHSIFQMWNIFSFSANQRSAFLDFNSMTHETRTAGLHNSGSQSSFTSWLTALICMDIWTQLCASPDPTSKYMLFAPLRYPMTYRAAFWIFFYEFSTYCASIFVTTALSGHAYVEL